MSRYCKSKMQFDQINSKDLDRIKQLQPKGWPDITEDFKKYLSYEFCDPIKVMIDGDIVGIGNTILFQKSAWLAHVIVDKKFRKKGIGFEIVDYLLSNIKKNHINSILLIATEFGEPVYKKAGFKIVSDYTYLKREKTWIEKEISKNIHPYTPEYYDQITDLDNLISGELRESLLKKYLNDCFMYIEKQSVKGYYLPSLGEGAIYATHPVAGIALMKLKYSKSNSAVIPSENKHGIDFLISNGFVNINAIGRRMTLGKDINWKPDFFYSRIGGNYG